MHRNIIKNAHHHDTLGLSYTVSGTRDNPPPRLYVKTYAL